MDQTEQVALFWTQVGAIGQVAGAFTTAIAVTVSLWIVLSERAVRLSCNVGLRIIVGSPGPSYDVLSFDITNTGQRSVRISSTGWRTGWQLPLLSRFGWSWAGYQYAIQITSTDIGSPQLPLDLAPGHRISIFTDAARIKEQNEAKRIDFFCRKLPISGRIVSAPIYGCIDVPGQKTRYVKVESKLRNLCATGHYDNSVSKKLNVQQ